MSKEKQREFMALYEPIHDGFVRFCSAKSFGVIDTEDLVQETIAITFEKLEKVRDKKAILGFMMSVANNLVNSQLRRKKFKGECSDQAMHKLEALTQSPELALDIAFLYRQMQKLPKKAQDALLLYEISGFSIKEIAESQNSSESAVKVRLMRARKKLTELCEEKSGKSLHQQLQTLSLFLI
ncbi:MAG: sigma-70 family RNA polymerase sigma factor [Bacteroidota bacterium]